MRTGADVACAISRQCLPSALHLPTLELCGRAAFGIPLLHQLDRDTPGAIMRLARLSALKPARKRVAFLGVPDAICEARFLRLLPEPAPLRHHVRQFGRAELAQLPEALRLFAGARFFLAAFVQPPL